ncbi:hypothetical protein [Burkholderia pseudomallei]|uniref:hypothetical protein n=1 Tax=Burkholderia pseudomallei TaxID=28450 RepID=UPI000CCDF89A|nr:hypothetical protein [Burkholderia pseudomallei]PNW93130.1 hypothetical protein CF640_19200 [Burkholderia pseudomallei]PNX20041.1 hypothetical protein CF645_21365 [Burkholderia pseudomallei]
MNQAFLAHLHRILAARIPAAFTSFHSSSGIPIGFRFIGTPEFHAYSFTQNAHSSNSSNG